MSAHDYHELDDLQNHENSNADNSEQANDGFLAKLSPYAKVAIKGIIAGGALSGIWSSMSNITSLLVYPTIKIGAGQIYDGISCVPSSSNFDQSHGDFCDDIAAQMANQTSSHPEWDCHELIDTVNLTNDSSFELRDTFIKAMIFMGMAVIYSIAHDWALIYHHANGTLHELQFWPSKTLSEDFTVYLYVSNLLDLYMAEALFGWVKPVWNKSRCVCILLSPFIVIALLIYFVCFSLTVMVIPPLEFCVNLVCCGLPRHYRCDSCGECPRECCKGLVEVSACGVGVARFCVVFCALTFVMYGISDLAYSIDTTADCKCQCNYALNIGDALSFILASSILVIINIIFLNSWRHESEFRRFYFYLLSYTVPTVCVDTVKKTDLTVLMIKSPQSMDRKYFDIELTVSTDVNVIEVAKEPVDAIEEAGNMKEEIQGNTISNEIDSDADDIKSEVGENNEVLKPNGTILRSSKKKVWIPHGQRDSKFLRHVLFGLSMSVTTEFMCLYPSILTAYYFQAFWGWGDTARYTVYILNGIIFVAWFVVAMRIFMKSYRRWNYKNNKVDVNKKNFSRFKPSRMVIMSTLFSLFGYGAIAYAAVKVGELIWQLYRPPIKLSTFGSWTVITGATDGIGKAMAFELAKQGQNLLIIGRNKEKLATTIKEIGSKYQKIEIDSLQIDLSKFHSDSALQDKYVRAIESKDVGILVNNAGSYSIQIPMKKCNFKNVINPVTLQWTHSKQLCDGLTQNCFAMHSLKTGLAYPYTNYFDEVDQQRVENMVYVNNLSPTILMQRTISTKFLKKKKSAIVNISSAGSILPHPLHVVYSATKSFLNKISVDLASEYGPRGISVQSQMPYFVVTNMSKIKRPSFTTPTATDYAKAAVKQIGYNGLISPYPVHAVIFFVLRMIPDILMTYFVFNLHAKIKKKGDRKYGKKQ